MSLFLEKYNKLNKAQKEAVNSIYGPILVLAGPGTGKTEILSLRIANILKKTDANPENILCITYTDVGATNMRERLKKYIGNLAYKVNIFTFHALCNEIIINNPEYFAERGALTQISDIQKQKILRTILDQYDREKEKRPLVLFNDKYKYAKEILEQIGILKKEDILPEEFLKKSQQLLEEHLMVPKINKKTQRPTVDWQTKTDKLQKMCDLAEVYQNYSLELKKNGLYDYDDMILQTIKALQENEALLAKYQELFQFTLIDEFQDTNGSQFKVIELLTSFDNSPNLFAVGDDDQSIFRFQGANLSNIINFTQKFPGTKTITVTTNYRSNQSILNLADSLISNNTERISVKNKEVNKKLVKGVLDLPEIKPKLIEFENQDLEYIYLIDSVKDLINSGEDPEDIAVLFSKNVTGEEIAELFIKSKIPVKLNSGRNALDEPFVKTFWELLKAADGDPVGQNLTVFTLLLNFLSNIPADDFYKLSVDYKKEKTFNREYKDLGFMEYLLNPKTYEKLDINTGESIIEFLNKIKKWHISSFSQNILLLIQEILEDTGYIEKFVEKNKDNAIEPVNSFLSFFDYVKTQVKAMPDLKLAEFLNEVNLMNETKIVVPEKELKTDQKGVTLSTVHSAKGLEFKYVFFVDLTNKEWGAIKKSNHLAIPPELVFNSNALPSRESQIEDRRRLFFVAVTRAKQYLTLMYPLKYSDSEKEKEEVSSFIGEIDKTLIEVTNVNTNNKAVTDFALLKLKSDAKTRNESKFLKQIVENFELSPTNLNSYITCPLEFKYNYLVKVPSVSNQATALGTAIHSALEKWNRNIMESKPTSFEELVSQFKLKVSKEIIPIAMQDSVLKEGIKLLQGYFDYYKGISRKPVKVEYNFSQRNIYFPLSNGENIKLTGKIDCIDLIDKNTISLIDYKVSSPKYPKLIMGNPPYWENNYRQLLFYKLLIDLDTTFFVDRSLTKPGVLEVILNYVKPQKQKYIQRAFVITSDETDAFKSLINKVTLNIKNLEFYGTNEFPLCKKCKWCQLNLA